MNSTVFPKIGAVAAAIPVAMSLPVNKVVVLAIDNLRLILPQADIRTVESVSDIELADKMPRSAGWIKYLGQRWPVVCFSDELTFLDQVPSPRRACVMLAFNGAYLGLLCDDARVLVNFSHQSFAVPASMRMHASPLTGLFQYEQGLACLSDASHIHSYVNHYLNLALLMQEEEVN
jgi:chemotaxis signal transduction protein